MELTGPQYEALQKALLSAFPTGALLAQMVRFQLGENLAAIAEGGALKNTVFKLIEWAQSQGRLVELVTGALKANPGNPGLRTCAAQLGIPAPAPTPAPAPPPVSNDKPPEVFFSYAPKDKNLREDLEKHLSIMARHRVITGWHADKIEAGQEKNAELLSRLESADVILLLISSDFLASDVCYSVEMQRAMERQAAGEALVIPILLRPCDWTDAPFSKLKALPSDDRAVTSWGDRDEAFTNIARGIRSAVERWRSRR